MHTRDMVVGMRVRRTSDFVSGTVKSIGNFGCVTVLWDDDQTNEVEVLARNLIPN